MQRSRQQLRDDARRIWWAGVEAVQPRRLIPEYLAVDGDTLRVGDHQLDLGKIGRLVVVGAGKAGASMTSAVEVALGEDLLQSKQVTGLVNVPADCIEQTRCVRLHAARPAGVNEPTADGVAGTQEILRLVASLAADDLCLCLISGGGSALLPAPVEGLSLVAKVELTREIAARGGSIGQLNTVRREISAVKGGGLARACRAGRLVTLILSDVLGDDLATIASGPTVVRQPTPEAAVTVLEELQLTHTPAGREAITALARRRSQHVDPCTAQVTNLLIGNNATAVDAAGTEAESLGYRPAMISATEQEPTAEEVATHLAQMAVSMRDGEGPDCLISGGEPTVQLAPKAERGLGGRNQQLALAALAAIDDWRGLALLSGGTDGEDGPTDAAGAVVNAAIAESARDARLDPGDFLRRNDAYHFFEPLGALVKTGPTHTNVCDVRVIVASQGGVISDE